MCVYMDRDNNESSRTTYTQPAMETRRTLRALSTSSKCSQPQDDVVTWQHNNTPANFVS